MTAENQAATDQAAYRYRAYAEKLRWSNGKPTCPYCGNHWNVGKRHKDMRYRCGNCSRNFSVITGTALSKSNLPLEKWFEGIKIVSRSRINVSSKRLEREVGLTYKTAWRMNKILREVPVNYTQNTTRFDALLSSCLQVRPKP